MNVLVASPSSKQESNIGILVEGNAYFVAGFAYYLAMQPDQLDRTIQHLQELRRETYSRFIRHPTVRRFGLVCAVLFGFIFIDPADPQSPGIAAAGLVWLLAAYLPSFVAMMIQREDMSNALRKLREEIKMAKAARATK